MASPNEDHDGDERCGEGHNPQKYVEAMKSGDEEDVGSVLLFKVAEDFVVGPSALNSQGNLLLHRALRRAFRMGAFGQNLAASAAAEYSRGERVGPGGIVAHREHQGTKSDYS